MRALQGQDQHRPLARRWISIAAWMACALACGAQTQTQTKAPGGTLSPHEPQLLPGSYQYDNSGRLVRAVFADLTAIDYTYDLSGNLLRVRPTNLLTASLGLEGGEGSTPAGDALDRSTRATRSAGDAAALAVVGKVLISGTWRGWRSAPRGVTFGRMGSSVTPKPPDPAPSTATSTSLLEGLRDPENCAVWDAYVARYRPLIVRYARRVGVPAGETEDVAQTALLEFSRALLGGGYDRDRGRLRSWMFGIVGRQVSRWRERVRPREVPTSDASAAGERLRELADPEDLEAAWEDEWRQAVLRQCLEEIRREVEPATFEAFQRFALEGRPAQEVAAELGITANAVFGAKRRLLERIRELLPLMEEIW